MQFIRNNEFRFVLAAVVLGVVTMACVIGVEFRGGQPWDVHAIFGK